MNFPYQSKTKTFAETTSNYTFLTEHISVTLSQFILNLNSQINQLITFISSVLNSPITNGSIYT